MEKYDFQVGDDLICSGDSRASNVIKRMNRFSGTQGEAAEMTHVAMILRPPVFTYKEGFQVFDSTSIGYTGIKGVQMNPFEEWLENYNGHVWWVHYNMERTVPFEQEFLATALSKLGTPYESGIAGGYELFLAGLRMDRIVRYIFPRYNPCSTHKLHCSELNVILKKHMGMLSSDVIASRMPPCEFWPGGELYRYFTSAVRGADFPVQLK